MFTRARRYELQSSGKQGFFVLLPRCSRSKSPESQAFSADADRGLYEEPKAKINNNFRRFVFRSFKLPFSNETKITVP